MRTHEFEKCKYMKETRILEATVNELLAHVDDEHDQQDDLWRDLQKMFVSFQNIRF